MTIPLDMTRVLVLLDFRTSLIYPRKGELDLSVSLLGMPRIISFPINPLKGGGKPMLEKRNVYSIAILIFKNVRYWTKTLPGPCSRLL